MTESGISRGGSSVSRGTRCDRPWYAAGSQGPACNSTWPRGCREGKSREKEGGIAPTGTDVGLSMKSAGSHWKALRREMTSRGLRSLSEDHSGRNQTERTQIPTPAGIKNQVWNTPVWDRVVRMPKKLMTSWRNWDPLKINEFLHTLYPSLMPLTLQKAM